MISKEDFLIKYADQTEDNGEYFVSYECIVGLFAGGACSGADFNEARTKVIDFLDQEARSEVESMVRDRLNLIGWQPTGSDILYPENLRPTEQS